MAQCERRHFCHTASCFFVMMTVGAVIAVFNVCLPGVDNFEVFAYLCRSNLY